MMYAACCSILPAYLSGDLIQPNPLMVTHIHVVANASIAAKLKD
jgi:hypothetical protein